ncbi:MAG: Adenylosuccinate synthetase [Candidatus Uhrbacteria bacterium GW2011_GWE2_46_68]|uniref:Adenylosuccinate synthetase n=2 Tax=Candidatus Uhriibacteriota TaxID=1752732 RepID=A0A0G1Q7B1_9BACT|nr:MAG: Adenylosuccinate synthetase [Candidatus Uhrbacteria bacterium GW2011_GWF2_46_218]KKU40722.1 MAG: Adenylosuccinate synthetase [Candidatus Uhrbacteria bacterium GW2011_GWE2_46_68]
MTRALILCDLGFGDGTKGATTDFLARSQGFRSIMRYTGGPQARHFVTTPQGVVHGFAQCCSGMFVPGTSSILSSSMLVDLIALQGEIQTLEKIIGQPIWERVVLDSSSTLVTPFHAVMGQLMELRRGEKRHGSCGMGVGQSVFERKAGQELTIQKLFEGDGRRLLVDWQKQMEELIACTKKDFPHLGEACDASTAFFHQYLDASYLLGIYGDILQKAPCRITDTAAYVRELVRDGHDLLLEGAQGALLDREQGFFPFVTKTCTTCHEAQRFLNGLDVRVKKMGVLRAYMHRHGAGPFVTEDAQFASKMHDRNNAPNPWQGPMRFGHPDLLLWRYGLALNGGVDTLAISCLDELTGTDSIRLCTSYQYSGKEAPEVLNRFFTWDTCCSTTRITKIRVVSDLTPDDHAKRTSILVQCRPLEWMKMSGWHQDIRSARQLEDLPTEARQFLDVLEGPKGLHTPISIVSVGPTWEGRMLC